MNISLSNYCKVKDLGDNVNMFNIILTNENIKKADQTICLLKKLNQNELKVKNQDSFYLALAESIIESAKNNRDKALDLIFLFDFIKEEELLFEKLNKLYSNLTNEAMVTEILKLPLKKSIEILNKLNIKINKKQLIEVENKIALRNFYENKSEDTTDISKYIENLEIFEKNHKLKKDLDFELQELRLVKRIKDFYSLDLKFSEGIYSRRKYSKISDFVNKEATSEEIKLLIDLNYLTKTNFKVLIDNEEVKKLLLKEQISDSSKEQIIKSSLDQVLSLSSENEEFNNENLQQNLIEMKKYVYILQEVFFKDFKAFFEKDEELTEIKESSLIILLSLEKGELRNQLLDYLVKNEFLQIEDDSMLQKLKLSKEENKELYKRVKAKNNTLLLFNLQKIIKEESLLEIIAEDISKIKVTFLEEDELSQKLIKNKVKEIKNYILTEDILTEGGNFTKEFREKLSDFFGEKIPSDFNYEDLIKLEKNLSYEIRRDSEINFSFFIKLFQEKNSYLNFIKIIKREIKDEDKKIIFKSKKMKDMLMRKLEEMSKGVNLEDKKDIYYEYGLNWYLEEINIEELSQKDFKEYEVFLKEVEEKILNLNLDSIKKNYIKILFCKESVKYWSMDEILDYSKKYIEEAYYISKLKAEKIKELLLKEDLTIEEKSFINQALSAEKKYSNYSSFNFNELLKLKEIANEESKEIVDKIINSYAGDLMKIDYREKYEFSKLKELKELLEEKFNLTYLINSMDIENIGVLFIDMTKDFEASDSEKEELLSWLNIDKSQKKQMIKEIISGYNNLGKIERIKEFEWYEELEWEVINEEALNLSNNERYSFFSYIYKNKNKKEIRENLLESSKAELIHFVKRNVGSFYLSIAVELLTIYPKEDELKEIVFRQRYDIREDLKRYYSKYKKEDFDILKEFKSTVLELKNANEKINAEDIVINNAFIKLSKEKQEAIKKYLVENNFLFKSSKVQTEIDSVYMKDFLDNSEVFYIEKDGKIVGVDFLLSDVNSKYYQKYLETLKYEEKEHVALQRFKTIEQKYLSMYSEIIVKKQIEYSIKNNLDSIYIENRQELLYKNERKNLEKYTFTGKNLKNFQKTVGLRPNKASDIDNYEYERLGNDTFYNGLTKKESFLFYSILEGADFSASLEENKNEINYLQEKASKAFSTFDNKSLKDYKLENIKESINYLEQQQRLEILNYLTEDIPSMYGKLKEKEANELLEFLLKEEKVNSYNFKLCILEIIEQNKKEDVLERLSKIIQKDLMSTSKVERGKYTVLIFDELKEVSEYTLSSLIKVIKSFEKEEMFKNLIENLIVEGEADIKAGITLNDLLNNRSFRILFSEKIDMSMHQKKIDALIKAILIEVTGIKSTDLNQKYQLILDKFPIFEEYIEDKKREDIVFNFIEEKEDIELEVEESFDLSIDKVNMSLFNDIEIVLLNPSKMDKELKEVYENILSSQKEFKYLEKKYEILSKKEIKRIEKIKNLESQIEIDSTSKQISKLKDEVLELKKLRKVIFDEIYLDINLKLKIFLECISPNIINRLSGLEKEILTKDIKNGDLIQKIWNFNIEDEEISSKKITLEDFNLEKFIKIIEALKSGKYQEKIKKGKKTKEIERDFYNIKEFEETIGFNISKGLNKNSLDFLKKSILFRTDIFLDNSDEEKDSSSIKKYLNDEDVSCIFKDKVEVSELSRKREKLKDIIKVLKNKYKLERLTIPFEGDSNYKLKNSHYEDVLNRFVLNFPQNSVEESIFDNKLNNKRRIIFVNNLYKIQKINKEKYREIIYLDFNDQNEKTINEVIDLLPDINQSNHRKILKLQREEITQENEITQEEDYGLINYFKYLTIDDFHYMSEGTLKEVKASFKTKLFKKILKEAAQKGFNEKRFKLFYERIGEIEELELELGKDIFSDDYEIDLDILEAQLKARSIRTRYTEIIEPLFYSINSASAQEAGIGENILSSKTIEEYENYRENQIDKDYQDNNIPMVKKILKCVSERTKEDEYYLVEFISSKDPRILFTGEATSCCRVAGGVGSSHIDFEIENQDKTGTIVYGKIKSGVSKEKMKEFESSLKKYNERILKFGNTKDNVMGEEASNINDFILKNSLMVAMSSSWRNGNQFTLNNVEARKVAQIQETGSFITKKGKEYYRELSDGSLERLGVGKIEGSNLIYKDINDREIIIELEEKEGYFKEMKTVRVNDIESQIIDLNTMYLAQVKKYNEYMLLNDEDIKNYALFKKSNKQLDDISIEKKESIEEGKKKIRSLPLFMTMGKAYGSRKVRSAYKEIPVKNSSQEIPVKFTSDGKKVYTDTAKQVFIGGFENEIYDYSNIENVEKELSSSKEIEEERESKILKIREFIINKRASQTKISKP